MTALPCEHRNTEAVHGELQILERLLLEGSYTHVVYIGDGRNDLCPCTRLGPGDAILARSQVLPRPPFGP